MYTFVKQRVSLVSVIYFINKCLRHFKEMKMKTKIMIIIIIVISILPKATGPSKRAESPPLIPILLFPSYPSIRFIFLNTVSKLRSSSSSACFNYVLDCSTHTHTHTSFTCSFQYFLISHFLYSLSDFLCS